MTADGMRGVFIPHRVLVRWWRSQCKPSARIWASKCTTDFGRGRYIIATAGGINLMF